MKKFVSLLAIAVSVVLVTGCEKEDDTILIGANIYNFADNFMNGVVQPALKETAAGYENVELEIVDSENQQSKLNDQVDVFIDKGVDVLAINLVDPAAASTIIAKAKAADIPLILFNKEASKEAMAEYDKVWYVGTQSKDAGVIQGEMMAAAWQANPDWDLNGDGIAQYVLLKGEPGHPDAEARTEWAVKTMNSEGVQTEELELQTGMWATDQAKNIMDAWLSAHTDIELVITNNDGMAFGAYASMEGANTFLPLFGVDALAQALTMIGDGQMQGTVLNDGVNQARATIELAVNAAMGNDVVEGTDWTIETDGTKAVRVPYVAVTPENYKEFQ
jgi:methyl-galactoside transport system substrate-binding protein